MEKVKESKKWKEELLLAKIFYCSIVAIDDIPLRVFNIHILRKMYISYVYIYDNCSFYAVQDTQLLYILIDILIDRILNHHLFFILIG